MDNVILARQMQLQRTIGELRVLEVSYYNPMDSASVIYREVHTLIKGIILELENELG